MDWKSFFDEDDRLFVDQLEFLTVFGLPVFAEGVDSAVEVLPALVFEIADAIADGLGEKTDELIGFAFADAGLDDLGEKLLDIAFDFGVGGDDPGGAGLG